MYYLERKHQKTVCLGELVASWLKVLEVSGLNPGAGKKMSIAFIKSLKRMIVKRDNLKTIYRNSAVEKFLCGLTDGWES